MHFFIWKKKFITKKKYLYYLKGKLHSPFLMFIKMTLTPSLVLKLTRTSLKFLWNRQTFPVSINTVKFPLSFLVWRIATWTMKLATQTAITYSLWSLKENILTYIYNIFLASHKSTTREMSLITTIPLKMMHA